MSAALILERLNNSGRSWSMRAGDAGPGTSGIFLLLNHSSPRLTGASVPAARLLEAPPPPLTRLDTFMFTAVATLLAQVEPEPPGRSPSESGAAPWLPGVGGQWGG